VRTITALGVSSAIVLASLGIGAEQPTSARRVGVLVVSYSPESKEAQAFRQGLREAGYAEGRDVVIEWRSSNGDYARLSELATDLVQRKVDVIVVETTVAARAAKQATSTIPIVVAIVADPVGSGLVASLARPGGNVTGISMMLAELGDKRLQLLKEAIPGVTRVAVLWNPATPWHAKVVDGLKATAPSLRIELSFVAARTPEELSAAFFAASRAHAHALYVLGDPVFLTQRRTLLKLASNARLPAMYWVRDFPDQGGLMSYGPNNDELFRQSAGYVDKILKGA
jgi:putative ABC transport system substrate-binding protein